MRPILAILVLLASASRLDAATLYAKAAGGNWSAAATWSSTGSGGMDNSGPPAAGDAVILEAGSGNVVIDTVGQTALTVSMTAGTGDYAGTLSCQAGLTLAIAKGSTGTAWTASTASVLSLTDCTIGLTQAAAASTITFVGAGKTYGIVSVILAAQSTLVLTGANTFQRLSLAPIGIPSGVQTITLPAGVTTVLNDLYTNTTAGAFGQTSVLQSDTGGMPTTLSKSSGIIDASSLTVTDTTTTGGATWCDGSLGGDGGGNTGWSFTACPYGASQTLTGVGR